MPQVDVSPIATLINSTPELKKKLSTLIVINVGQRYFIIDPMNPGLHVFTEGQYKGAVFQSYQAITTLDVKGNAFVPTPRGKKGSKDGKNK